MNRMPHETTLIPSSGLQRLPGPVRLVLVAALALACLGWAARAEAAQVTGIADENLEQWSPAVWSAFNATGVKQVRHIVPWDVALSGHGTQLSEAEAWINAANAHGLQILISFGHDGANAPSTAKYDEGIVAFRKKFPGIGYYTAWNEPNHHLGSEPNANPDSNPAQAAIYWASLNAICHTPEYEGTCTVVGGDFLDPNGDGSSLKSYITTYKNKLTELGAPRPSIWSIHPYTAAETGESKALNEAFLEQTEGKPIWFTEVGGMVCKPSSGLTGASYQAAEEFQKGAAERLLALMASQGSRLERTYYYMLSGGSAGSCPNSSGVNVFDSALLEENAVPRIAFKTIFPNSLSGVHPESDVDGDGHGDLVTLFTGDNGIHGTAAVYPGGFNRQFGVGVLSFGGTMAAAEFSGSGHYPIDMGDVNGDGRADLVTLTSSGTAYVYPGTANRSFGAGIPSFAGTMLPGILTNSGGHEPIGVADVNHDGYGDLVTFAAGLGKLITYPGSASGTFGAGSISQSVDSALFDGIGEYFVDVADVNGDGYADVVGVDRFGQVADVYPGSASGAFGAPIESFRDGITGKGTFDVAIPDAVGHEPVAVADVNGDGRADLVTWFTGDHNVYVYEGQGNGTFGASVASFAGTMQSRLFGGGTGHELATVIDINGDGYGDLVTAASNGNVYGYAGQPSGTFGEGAASFGGTFVSRQANQTAGHEIVMEKSMVRRRGCLANGCPKPEPH